MWITKGLLDSIFSSSSGFRFNEFLISAFLKALNYVEVKHTKGKFAKLGFSIKVSIEDNIF